MSPSVSNPRGHHEWRTRAGAVRAKLAGCVAATAASIATSPVHACTLCHSRMAEDVRAAVLGADFWTNSAILLLPVPILLAAAHAVLRSFP